MSLAFSFPPKSLSRPVELFAFHVVSTFCRSLVSAAIPSQEHFQISAFAGSHHVQCRAAGVGSANDICYISQLPLAVRLEHLAAH